MVKHQASLILFYNNSSSSNTHNLNAGIREFTLQKKPSLSVIVAYLQPAAGIVLPWTEKRVDRLLKAGFKHVQSLHCDGVIKTKTTMVIVQENPDPRRVPVVSDWDAPVLFIGIETVLQTQAPVPRGGSEADKALPVAALCGDSQVPHTFVPHIYLPVMLAAGILGCCKNPTEAGEAKWQVGLLVTKTSLLYFGVKI